MARLEQDRYFTPVIRAGASGFLVKDTEPADLIRSTCEASLSMLGFYHRGGPPRDAGRSMPPSSQTRTFRCSRPGQAEPMNVGPTGSLKL